MFSSLDPLRVKLTSDNVAANNAMRREIANILGSYVGWFDPFAEAWGETNGVDVTVDHIALGELPAALTAAIDAGRPRSTAPAGSATTAAEVRRQPDHLLRGHR